MKNLPDEDEPFDLLDDIYIPHASDDDSIIAGPFGEDAFSGIKNQHLRDKCRKIFQYYHGRYEEDAEQKLEESITKIANSEIGAGLLYALKDEKIYIGFKELPGDTEGQFKSNGINWIDIEKTQKSLSFFGEDHTHSIEGIIVHELCHAYMSEYKLNAKYAATPEMRVLAHSIDEGFAYKMAISYDNPTKVKDRTITDIARQYLVDKKYGHEDCIKRIFILPKEVVDNEKLFQGYERLFRIPREKLGSLIGDIKENFAEDLKRYEQELDAYIKSDEELSPLVEVGSFDLSKIPVPFLPSVVQAPAQKLPPTPKPRGLDLKRKLVAIAKGVTNKITKRTKSQ